MGDDTASTAESATKDTTATDATTTNAHTSGAGNGENGGDGGFKAITSEAELTAWKEATRKDMLAEARKTADADAKRKADADAAKAKGDFEALAKSAQEERDALKAELAERDRRDLRARVARTHKLPDDLAALLQGDDEAALVESAKLLAKHLKPVAAPDTEAGAGVGTASKVGDRPLPKKSDEKVPAYTFDGRPKVAWPNRG